MIELDHALKPPLKANSRDRFSDGKRYLYPGTTKPISKLRFLGARAGKFYYAPAEDKLAAMPADPFPEQSAPVAAALPPRPGTAFLANCTVNNVSIDNMDQLTCGDGVVLAKNVVIVQ